MNKITSLKEEQKAELQNELIREISNRNNCDISCNVTAHTVWIHNEDYTTEFRYVIFLNRVIVSRVCFTNKHSGCMTACFEILKRYANQFRYNIITIQSVETYEMMQWCKKMNFIPKEYNIEVQDTLGRSVLVGDYNFTDIML